MFYDRSRPISLIVMESGFTRQTKTILWWVPNFQRDVEVHFITAKLDFANQKTELLPNIV